MYVVLSTLEIGGICVLHSAILKILNPWLSRKYKALGR